MNQIKRAESIRELDELHSRYCAAAAVAERHEGRPDEAAMWDIANAAWADYKAAVAGLKGVQR